MDTPTTSSKSITPDTACNFFSHSETLAQTYSVTLRNFNGRPTLRALLQDEHHLNKSIQTTQARINYLTSKNRTHLQQTLRQQKTASRCEQRSNSRRRQKARMHQNADLEELLKSTIDSSIDKSRTQTRQVLPVKPHVLKFLPGNQKCKPKDTSVTLVPLEPSHPSLQELKERISQIRQSRQKRQQLRKTLIYSTKYHRACQIRNIKKLSQQHEIQQCQKRLAELQERQSILLQRLHLSEKFKDTCESEYRAIKEKYEAICSEKALNKVLFQD